MSQTSGYTLPYRSLGGLIGDEEIGVLQEVLTSGEPLSQGRWRERFEGAFSALLGVRHALSVTSGTVALEIAIRLLELAPGDEVITSPQTYQATVQALLGTGVHVRFCDVDADTLNIDPALLGAVATSRTRAIILVHYGGLPAAMNEIMKFARAHGILVVEDCAHALGALYEGRPPGALADIGCFSFHSSKTITTLGEGGMITFDRDDWAERVRRIRGNECDGVYRETGGRLTEVPKALYPGLAYTHDCLRLRAPGTNATMSEPAAAVGLVQLRRLAALSARRRRVAERIDAHLAAGATFRPQVTPAGSVHGHHLYTCFVRPGSGVDRDALVRALEERGVEVWLRYFPLHLLPEWRARGHGDGECPVAERAWFDEQLNLPCHPGMTDGELDRMLAVLDEAVAAVRPRSGTHVE
ncbi:DegT/DnrJ/EryC1/StrS family aminotransferase [Actinomadura monticuli]|uniref:DegT/DnrJ/EryC1/StrS family aminotransferase n=1 Tax=Actinomadura monticuli TaxID=3097367 RepID=A0ABV4Q4L8_9ACTN